VRDPTGRAPVAARNHRPAKDQGASRDFGPSLEVRGRGQTKGFPKGVTPGTFLISVSCTEDSIDVAKDRLEKAYLEELLRVVSGNVSEAARIAGIGRAAVHQKLRRHQIEAGRFRR